MTQYVYIISDHDEHGAESVRATLDVKMVPTLIRDLIFSEKPKPWWSVPDFENGKQSYLEQVLARLEELVNSKTDEELSMHITGMNGTEGSPGHCLTDGWGGVQLHVVKLT